jgi:hypothetical protein
MSVAGPHGKLEAETTTYLIYESRLKTDNGMYLLGIRNTVF